MKKTPIESLLHLRPHPDELVQAGQDLARAAELIEQHGWTQHQMVTYRGCMCALGAMRKAVTGNAAPEVRAQPGQGRRIDMAVCVVRVSASVRSIVAFNDKRGTTQQHVVNALRRAAEEAPTILEHY